MHIASDFMFVPVQFHKKAWGDESAILFPENHINFIVTSSSMPVLLSNAILNQLND